jgi:hypothetical protein
MTDVSSIYYERLEEDIISKLAAAKGIGLSEAMDAYYRSRLAHQIAAGEFGIQYLSADYLVDDLIENEPELFK